ncbi:MAG: SpoIID/LytB domain-containing protein [Myxococcota bacterium]
MRVEFWRLSRSPISACLAFVVVGLLACGVATAGVEPKIRVLLYSGTDPIRMGLIAEPKQVALASGAELLVDGEKSAKIWAPVGSGPWRVGSRIVRGDVVVRVRKQRIEVVNRIGLEDYVASTVGGEMSPSWPTEALRAQAVAARTYVLHEARRKRSQSFDVRATAASQVYLGLEAETPETRSATRATEGEVLTYQGEPILAVFHSTAGGHTASAGEVWGEDLPYLQVIEVEDEDDAPHMYWRTAVGRQAMAEIMQGAGVVVGELQSLSIDRRTASGRVQSLLVKGTKGSQRFGGSELRSLLGGLALRSTLFEIRESADEFTFVGSGHGHGVGMSQWGARAMARRGASYQQILARFYPGTRLEKRTSHRAALRGSDRLNDQGDRK